MYISILVPVYKVEKYIERCARSLFEQTYRDIEYIFVDDCSPDNSINILKKVINDYPQRKEHVRIARHEINKGVSASRNTTLRICSGEFTVFVDPDDYMVNDAVEKLVKKQLETNADIVTGQVIRISKDHLTIMERPHFYNKDDFVEDMIKPIINHTLWGRLIRKSLYSEHDIQAKEGVNIGEDMQMMVQLAYYARKTESIWDIVYYYDCTNDHSCMNQHLGLNIKKLTQDAASMEIVNVFFNNKELRFYDYTEKQLMNYYLRLLDYYCEKGDRYNYNSILKKLFSLKQENRLMSRLRYLKIRHYILYRIKKHIDKIL